MTDKKYAYSTNEENFYGSFNSIHEAAQEGFDKNPDYDVIYIGTVVHTKSIDLISGRSIIDDMQSQADDIAGEYSDDYLEDLYRNKEKIAELEQLLAAWFDENYPVKFFTVDDVQTVNRNYDGGGAEESYIHASDCATHNEPAYPNGECDCGAVEN